MKYFDEFLQDEMVKLGRTSFAHMVQSHGSHSKKLREAMNAAAESYAIERANADRVKVVTRIEEHLISQAEEDGYVYFPEFRKRLDWLRENPGLIYTDEVPL